MNTFIIWAAVLAALTLAFILPPLLRPGKNKDVDSEAEQAATNLDVLRDDLAELERERSDGSLSEADFEQASNELKRRLLEESATDTEAQTLDPAARQRPATITAAILIVLIPLVATLAYLKLGEPRSLDPAQVAAPQGQGITPQQIEEMVGKLAERLKTNPDDTRGWVMLARSYKVLQRYSDAAEAYSHAGEMVDKDPMLLADYAEVLFLSGDGAWSDKSVELIERALKLDPDQPQALMMAGAAARDRGDLKAAETYWRHLLSLAEPGSEEAQRLEEAINQALAAPAQKK